MDSDHRQRNLGLVKKRGPLDAATPRRRWLAATLGFPTQSMSRGQPPCCCSFLSSFAFSSWTMDMSDRLINNRGMTQGFLLSQVQISRTLPARNAMFWRQETSLGFNYPARRPRASRPSISSQLSLSRVFACPFACRRLHGFFLGDGPMARLSVDIFRRPHRSSVGSVGTGELALPVCQPKTHDEGIAEIKAKARSSNMAPRRPPFGPRDPQQNGRQKLPRLQATAAGGVGSRPTSRLGVG